MVDWWKYTRVRCRVVDYCKYTLVGFGEGKAVGCWTTYNEYTEVRFIEGRVVYSVIYTKYRQASHAWRR